MGGLTTSAWRNPAFLKEEVKLSFSQLETTTSLDLGSLPAPILRSLAFRYGIKTRFPKMGDIASWSRNIRQISTWIEICQLLA